MNMSKNTLAALACGVLVATASVAGEKRFAASNPSWQEECGSCHLAFPPQLLPAPSWAAMMKSLERHFGSDASLDPAKTDEIARFLAANAGRRAAVGADGKPQQRITETAWFTKEHRDGHDGLTAAVWRSPNVKSAANCAACHREAAAGDYSERNIRIPK